MNGKNREILIAVLLVILAFILLYLTSVSFNKKENYTDLKTVILNRKITPPPGDLEFLRENVGCDNSDSENSKCIYKFTINHPRTPTIL